MGMDHLTNHAPVTLGDKLAHINAPQNRSNIGFWVQHIVFTLLNFVILTALIATSLWWYFVRPDADKTIMCALVVALFAFGFFVARQRRAIRPRAKQPPKTLHSLLANDHGDFMRDLRLDEKTAVIDGSNIYHFGRDNDLDAHPLGAIAHQLRVEEYRIICFFDANIFYTLAKHGAFPDDQSHSTTILGDIFGLDRHEIYVVPGGVQADKYILNCLKHLPLSFAVTNDLFRDYKKKFPTVMKGDQWRKGVTLSKGEIKLVKHRFETPIRLNTFNY